MAAILVDKNQLEILFKETMDPQIFVNEALTGNVVMKLSQDFTRELENDFKTKMVSKVRKIFKCLL